MATLKSQRNESEMEFLATARELQKQTVTRCVNMPKRYTFYGNVELAAITKRVYAAVKKANSIYPLNQHEAQKRRDYFIEAGCELQDFISQLELHFEIVKFDAKVLKELSSLAEHEIVLVKAVMKKDRERYKNLPT